MSAAQSKPAVLVTGAAGYIGKLLIAALAQRRDELSALVALDVADMPAAWRTAGVAVETLSVCDARLEDVLRAHDVDTVVHLASLVRMPKRGGEALAYRVDVEGTENVIAAAVAAGVRRLIVTTSGAAYGYHPDNQAWLTEDDPVRGNRDFPYAWHKRLIEERLADARERHPQLQQLVFRPGTVVGADVHSPVTDLFDQRAMIGVRGSDSPFVFVWDADVVECLVRGVFGTQTGIYNLAGDGAMTSREIARRLGKPYLPVPAAALKLALAVLRRAGVTPHGPEQVAFLRHRPVLSNRRLKERFGYAPQKTSREAFEIFAQSRERSHG